jgi:autotransporter-associated beta strand protein
MKTTLRTRKTLALLATQSLAATAVSVSAAVSAAAAADLTWNGSAGNWTDETAWNGSPWTDTSNAIFNGTGGTIALGESTAITVGDLTFSAGDYTIGATWATGPLTVSGTVDVANGVNATIAAQFNGANFVKTGDGTLTLTGGTSGTAANAFANNIAVNGGTLAFDNRYSIARNGTTQATITLATGTTLKYTGSSAGASGGVVANGNVTIDTGTGGLSTASLTGAADSGSVINITGAGTFTLTNTSIRGDMKLVKLNNNNYTIASTTGSTYDYTGGTYLGGGGQVLINSGDNVFGSGPLWVNSTLTRLDLRGTQQTVSALYDGDNGGGVIANQGGAGTSVFTVGEGTFSGTLTENTANNRYLKLVKTTGGTLALGGDKNNNYTGGTEITGGILLANFAAPASSAANYTLGNGTVLVTTTAAGDAAATATAGTLGGTGYIKSGAITIAAGGTLAPGADGTGTLTLIGSPLTLQTGAILAFTLGEENASTTLRFYNYTEGNLTLGDTLTLALTGATEGTFELFTFYSDATGTTLTSIGGQDFNKFTTLTGIDGYTATWDTTTTTGKAILKLTPAATDPDPAIPEPAATAAVLATLAARVYLTRRPAPRQM